MGRWLAAARALPHDGANSQKPSTQEPTELTKPSSVGFVSPNFKENRNFSDAVSGVAKLANSPRLPCSGVTSDKLSVAANVGAQCSLTLQAGRHRRADQVANLATCLDHSAYVANLATYAPVRRTDNLSDLKHQPANQVENFSTCMRPSTFHERAGMAAGGVPAAYLDAWAGYQCAPSRVFSADAWQQSIEDAELLLDQWGERLAEFEWPADAIFGPDGLAWFLRGEKVQAVGPDHAITASDRVYDRREGMTHA